MHVEQLWRFPVKSLRGEPLESAVLTEDGVVGDRLVHVRQHAHVVTGRTRPRLLGLTGSTAADGTALIEGVPWNDPAAAQAIREAAGPGAEAVYYSGHERFDVLPLLVATDGGVQAFGYNGRRLRPNIVIGGVPGLQERSWPGKVLRIGEVLIGLYSLRSRCIVTTIDPDTGEQDLNVLRKIHYEFAGRLALNCWVAQGGVIRVGDAAEIIEMTLPQPQPDGWIIGAPYSVA
ncbi:MOSC domain-containing protein [Jatrophihabitans sp.]|uniref:MOSC domain-containing protein n=1 Tax=Jatrophihabitans sp. TaxID=1932789 RepID=UPI0038CD921A